MALTKALVLSSGGMDSTACIALALEDNDEVETISFNYGQSHAIELEAARDVALFYNLEHTVVDLPPVFKGSGQSSLMGEVEHPDLTYKEIAEGEGVSPTYVPYRNGNLLSVATAWALTHGASTLYTGVHAEDARGWAYPDCTPEFVGAMANAIYVGTYHKVRLLAPFQYHTKSDIALAGGSLGAPFHLTHTCYKGMRPACGECPTCTERLGAFRIAGFEDPIEYAEGVDRNSPRYSIHG